MVFMQDNWKKGSDSFTLLNYAFKINCSNIEMLIIVDMFD